MKLSPLRNVRVVRSVLAAAVVLAGLLFAAGCKPKPSSYAATGAGHRVSATVEGERSSLQSNEREVVVASEHGKVVVEANRAMIEGLGWTPIPEKVDVTVQITSRKITVQAAEVSVSRDRK